MRLDLVLVAVSLGLASGALLLAGRISGESHGHERYGVLVAGRLVDAERGAPIAGVEVLGFRDAHEARDEQQVQRQLAWARDVARVAPEAAMLLPFCAARTDAAGAFSCHVRVSHVVRWTWPFGWASSPRPLPAEALRTLLVCWPDGRRAVVESIDGQWTWEETRHARARLEVGDLAVSVP